jgi:hypothetical protein
MTMKLDDLLARELGSRPADEDALAARVLQSLAARPLPSQRRPLFSRWWPTALLTADFAPAWPRVAALASAACFGIAIGLFGPDASLFEARSSASAATASEADVASLVFDAEPLTGARP